MRKMRINFKFNRKRRGSVLSTLTAVIIAVVGIIISAPFVWIVMILGANYHSFTFWNVLMLLGFILGGPMTIFGVINLFVSKAGASASTADIDLGRIRYAAEADRTDKRKDF